ncbi:hypothetical protein BT96DRAFT_386087 [Gymnopus androsaceus JB14]|uniref:Uncharacterized protein n=1 Tax=Gymnopus androsaceus JB14 TaxID=1447944 RepID=A0A6A4I365_9AGAR|nr:hypothetical protein BT96DRAFT_386087 [Gymnopus androsaceus JB14]
MDVPDYIHLTCRFILQTSSSKNTRMEWMKKSEAGAMREYFVMRPWSLSELIAGNQLQAWTRGMLAEDALRSFHERYGGSARDAYAFARRPSAFDKKITTATQAMAGYDDRRLENIWSSEPFYLDVPKDAGHALLSVFPVSDIDRCQFRISFP